MKHTLIGLMVLAVAMMPSVAGAVQLTHDQVVLVDRGQEVAGDWYASGGSVTVSGAIQGDVIAAGGAVVIDGWVQHDIAAAGGTVTINGPVVDDVRVAAGTVTIAGSVGGDVIAAGGTIHLLSGSLVNGDVIVAGGTVILEGRILGQLRGWAKEVSINGQIDGTTTLEVRRLVLDAKANIGGDLSYRSPEMAAVADGARIGGATHYTAIARNRAHSGALMFKLLGVAAFVKFLMMLVGGLLAVYVFRRLSRAVVEQAAGNVGRSFLTGFVTMIMVPIAVVILCITVLGIPVAVLTLLSYILFWIVSWILAPVLVGGWIHSLLAKPKEWELSWKTVLLGVVVLSLVPWIPFIGWLATCIVTILVFGAVAMTWHDRVWKNR